MFLEAAENGVVGTHIGARARGDLKGAVESNKVRLESVLPMEGSRLRYRFSGIVQGGEMQGDLDLGEYPPGRWVARRREARA